MTVKELAEKCNCTRSWIYLLAKRYGRLPTVEEVNERKGKGGRPRKYFTQGEK
jgi:hypothetical protein